MKLDDWIVFKLDPEAAQLVLHLRQKWNALFLRRMKNPNKAMSQQDEQVIKTLVTVITNEEQTYGLQQPLGIGQRPRPLLVDYYPATARRTEDYEEVSFSNKNYLYFVTVQLYVKKYFCLEKSIVKKKYTNPSKFKLRFGKLKFYRNLIKIILIIITCFRSVMFLKSFA